MEREKRLWFWLAGLMLFGALLYALSSVLTPFIAGLAVAYFLNPLADRLEKIVKFRALATALILLSFFAIVAGLVLALFPLLQAQVMGVVARMPQAVSAAHQFLDPLVADIQNRIGIAEMQKLRDSAGSFTGSLLPWLMSVLKGLFLGGKAFVNVLSLLFIMPVVAFFLLRDWHKLVAKVDEYLPRTYAPIIRAQFREINATIAGFVRGQAIVCICLGTIYATGLTLVGLDFGLLVGLVTGLLAFVPYVGMIIGLLVSFLLALIQFSDVSSFILVGAVFVVGQSIDAVFLTPNLVGGRVGLHPVWIIFALMTGGALFGFTGVLLAVPTAAVIGVLVRFALGLYRHSTLYAGDA